MNVRRCAHCGDELPAHHKYVYCWDGLEEFTQRQREIDEDPFVTCVAYGDFTDPRNGRNSVVVRCRRIRGKEIRQMVRAIEEVVRLWLDKGRDKTRRVGLDRARADTLLRRRSAVGRQDRHQIQVGKRQVGSDVAD